MVIECSTTWYYFEETWEDHEVPEKLKECGIEPKDDGIIFY